MTGHPCKAAMAKHINFAVRRLLYSSTAYLVHLLELRTDTEQAKAFFCAVRYIGSLTQKIMDRKARVEKDTALALARNRAFADMAFAAASKDNTPVPQYDKTEPIEVRLVNALSGEVCCSMVMSAWCLLGDAISRANCEVHTGSMETFSDECLMPDVDEYKPVDERQSQQRIHTLLSPGQKVIEVKVLKGQPMRRAKRF